MHHNTESENQITKKPGLYYRIPIIGFRPYCMALNIQSALSLHPVFMLICLTEES